jgi:hypothetical protein
MRPKTDIKDLSLRLQDRLKPDQHLSGVAGFLFFICLVICYFGILWMTKNGVTSEVLIGVWAVAWILLGIYFLFWLKIASQWEKAVILRMGKFHKLAGPGLFWLMPFVDTLANWIDHRVMVTPF